MQHSEGEPLGWLTFAAVVTARAYRTLLLSLTAVATLPLLIGWQTFLVSTGSMDPAVAAGDAMVAKPLASGTEIEVGRVYAFTDPDTPDRTLVHRVVGTDDDLYITRGDANPTPDTTPLAPHDFQARGVLLAPWIGLPVVWFQQSNWVPLALFMSLTALAFWLAVRNLDDEPPRHGFLRLFRSITRRRPAHRHDTQSRPKEPAALRRVRRLSTAVALALVLGGTSMVTAPQMADSAFTARSQNDGNAWTASTILRQPYVAAVHTDGPTGFWLFDETSGTTLANRITPANNGELSGTVALNSAGALPKNPGTSANFTSGLVVLKPSAGSVLVTNPFSFEFWIHVPSTSPTADRFVAGFQVGTSITGDWAEPRILLDSSRRISVPAAGIVSSSFRSTALTANAWHHVMLTSPAASALWKEINVYINGELAGKAEGTLDLTGIVSDGFWRLGSGHSAGTANFNSSIDNVSLYDKVLSAARVKAHYCAGVAGAPPYTASTPTVICRP